MSEEIDDSTPELDKYEESQAEDRPLTPRQELYCQEYIKDLNQTQAAIRAKYSKLNAQQQSSRLMSKAVVRNRIDELMEERANANRATADFVLNKLVQIASLDLSEAYDEHGRMKDIRDMPKHIRTAIAGVESFVELEGNFRGAQPIGEVRKIKLVSKDRALEMLGRHLKLFTDKVEHSNPDGKFAPLAIITMPSNGMDKPEVEE